MSAAAIEIVTLALRDRIAQALKEPDEAAAPRKEIFVGPLDAPGAQNRRIALFLHRIDINADLRNQAFRQPAASMKAPPTLHERALPLDLHYLVTSTLSPAQEMEPVKDIATLRDLGKVMLALNEQPTIAARVTGGQACTLVQESLSAEDLSRLWSLFPTVNYRTSVAYLLSPVWLVPDAPVAGAPVVDETYASRARMEA